jgi:GPI mannosyltransferase 2
MPPFFTILFSFLLAKSVLITIVLGTTFLTHVTIPFYHPPIWPFGYDSSSSLFLPDDPSKLGRIVAALFRWDSVYFISLADRGEYIWEQEWAFGPGWPTLIRVGAPCKSICYRANIVLRPYLSPSLDANQLLILTSIILSNVFHLLALIPLYYLTRRLFPLKPSLATITCIIHAFSPAGVFLLSGYTESSFAFLSFTGMALFHRGHRLLPALVWSLAGTIRSNALLWTGFFAWDALNAMFNVTRRNALRTALRIMYMALCATVSMSGFAWWQYSAWQQYCSSKTPEGWCANIFPLIYSHVQNTYW